MSDQTPSCSPDDVVIHAGRYLAPHVCGGIIVGRLVETDKWMGYTVCGLTAPNQLWLFIKMPRLLHAYYTILAQQPNQRLHYMSTDTDATYAFERSIISASADLSEIFDAYGIVALFEGEEAEGQYAPSVFVHTTRSSEETNEEFFQGMVKEIDKGYRQSLVQEGFVPKPLADATRKPYNENLQFIQRKVPGINMWPEESGPSGEE